MLILTIFIFLLILSVLVLIHEAGHFFVAKKLGIKVEEFGFGFPPRALSIKRGETIYSINWLPIGGFVKLYGEDAAGGGSIQVKSEKLKIKNSEDEKRAFYARPVWQRAAVVVAGVVMNTILACTIFYVFLGMSGFKTSIPLVTPFHFFGVHQVDKIDNTIVIDQIAPHSPAAAAGIVPPVQILSVNGKKIESADDFLQVVNSHKGKEISITWQGANQKKITAVVTPRLHPPQGEGSLGVRFGPVSLPTAELSYDTPVEKLFSGVIHPFNVLIYSFDALGKLISISFQEKSVGPVSEGVSGPVGIGSVVGSCLTLPTMKEKVSCTLNLAGLLSISLAFFNVLPIPALDGGRLFFIVFEGVTRKKVNPKYEGYAHAVGMVVLLGLVALITFHDLLKIFHP